MLYNIICLMNGIQSKKCKVKVFEYHNISILYMTQITEKFIADYLQYVLGQTEPIVDHWTVQVQQGWV